jgi:hypothetical protein
MESIEGRVERRRTMPRWLLLTCVFLAFVVFAAAQVPETAPADQTLKRGESISKALATVTSTAISPLLGVCVIGAWDYYHTANAQRPQLPFYQKPQFWIPIVILLVLIFIKDTFGGFAPLIKKPLDAVEVLLVNHASLVLIVLPVVMNQVAKLMGFASVKSLFANMLAGPVVYAASADAGSMHSALTSVTAVCYTTVGFAITFVVWLLGHSFDVLALVTPFPFVDFVLKAIRNGVFAVLLIAAVISPHLGLVLSLAIIAMSFVLFGWALRLAVFGALFAWSLLRMLVLDAQDKPNRGDRVPAFSARVKNVKRRTYGHLSHREDGSLVFRYRRLMFGPEKTVVIGRASSFDVGRGIFFPSLIEPVESAQSHRVVFRLLPTYRGAEESVRACLDCAQVRDLRLSKGLRSFWKFVTDDDSAAVGA